MAQFFYYSYTKPTTLAVDLTNTATSVQLTDGSSFPDPAIPGNGQYTALLGYGTEREEVVTVTAKASENVLTVIRGEDGSSALAQSAGDVVVHGVSARDFRGTLKSTGGTMTGPLVLDGDATEPLEAATFQQVEARVLRSGDTMEGPLALAGDATAPLEAVPLQQLASAVPIGAIMDFGGAVAPTGWHLCDGTAHGSAALEAVIGSPNTPDLRGRFTMGPSTTHPRGERAGADTHTLTAAESGLRQHGHGASSVPEVQGHGHAGTTDWNGTHGHAAPPGYNFLLTNPGGWANGSNSTGGVQRPSGYSGGTNSGEGNHAHTFLTGGNTAQHTHGITVNDVSAANASSAHNNLPPYQSVTKIIKKV